VGFLDLDPLAGEKERESTIEKGPLKQQVCVGGFASLSAWIWTWLSSSRRDRFDTALNVDLIPS
jgi:hypothetical protein